MKIDEQFSKVLEKAIDDGIAEIKIHFSLPGNSNNLAGGIAGFEACKGATLEKLCELHNDANEKVRRLLEKLECNKGSIKDSMNYWYWRYYELQIEFIWNVMSSFLFLKRESSSYLKPDITSTTSRGIAKAARLILELGLE